MAIPPINETPTIFIGLGTTGMKVLEHLQRFNYGAFGVNTPNREDLRDPLVQFIYVETDERSVPKATPAGDDLIQQEIYLDNVDLSVRALHDYPDGAGLDWLPELADARSCGRGGAGEMRTCGRLALWSSREQNATKFIQELWSKLQEAWTKVGGQQKGNVKVVVVSSFCGGTGSGTFLDVAYLARQCIAEGNPSDGEVYGLFLLPPGQAGEAVAEKFHANAYACLKDLDYYNNHPFPANWPIQARPVGGQYADGVKPFTHTTFMSCDRRGAQGVSLSHQRKLAALFLFSGSLGYFGHRKGALVNLWNDEGPGGFASRISFANIAGLIYPKLQIEEAASVELTREAIDKLTHLTQCYGNQINGSIVEMADKRLPGREMEAALKSAMEGLQIAGPSGTMRALLSEFAAQVLAEGIAEPLATLKTKLRPDIGEYYEMMKAKAPAARRALAEGLITSLRNNLERSESIEYARLQLERQKQILERSLKYMTDVSGDPGNWESKVDSFSEWVLLELPRALPTLKAKVLKERVSGLLELLKMHFMIPLIREIVLHINHGSTNSPLYALGLPSIPALNLMRETILAGKPEQDELDADGGGIQIQNFFPAGSFNDEIRLAVSTFLTREIAETKSNKRSRLQYRLDYEKTLWDLLCLKEKKFAHTLLYATTVKLRQLEVVQDLENVPAQLPVSELAGYARRLPVFASRNISSPPQFPAAIIAESQSVGMAVINSLNTPELRNAFPENKGVCVCSAMKNMILFVDERSDNFLPLNDLVHKDEWRSKYERIDPMKMDAYHTLRTSLATEADRLLDHPPEFFAWTENLPKPHKAWLFNHLSRTDPERLQRAAAYAQTMEKVPEAGTMRRTA